VHSVFGGFFFTCPTENPDMLAFRDNFVGARTVCSVQTDTVSQLKDLLPDPVSQLESAYQTDTVSQLKDLLPDPVSQLESAYELSEDSKRKKRKRENEAHQSSKQQETTI
jgi:hypothetical protein